MASVIVGLGQYNKLSQCGDLKNKHLFFTLLQARIPGSRCQYGSVPRECPLPGLQMTIFSLCPLMAKREPASTLASSFKETNPIQDGEI